jgi:hypothetical protein
MPANGPAIRHRARRKVGASIIDTDQAISMPDRYALRKLFFTTGAIATTARSGSYPFIHLPLSGNAHKVFPTSRKATCLIFKQR